METLSDEMLVLIEDRYPDVSVKMHECHVRITPDERVQVLHPTINYGLPYSEGYQAGLFREIEHWLKSHGWYAECWDYGIYDLHSIRLVKEQGEADRIAYPELYLPKVVSDGEVPF